MKPLTKILLISIIGFILAWIPRSKHFPTPDTNKTKHGIFITGCSSGLGADLAKTLVNTREDTVVFAGVRKVEDGTKLLKKIPNESARKRFFPIVVDVSNKEQMLQAYTSVSKVLNETKSTLYGIVANAAMGGKPVDFSEETGDPNEKILRDVMEVNVFGVLRTVQTFLPLLRSNTIGGGRIINIGSIMGFVYTPKCYAYCSSKFALEALTDSWRADLFKVNISVSIIEPGFFKSEMCNQPFCVDDVSVCTNTVLQSLYDEYPLTRYLCAHVFYIPSYVFPWLVSFVPDRLVDTILYLAESQI